MATPAQIAANRRNAQRSTGPTSAEGKARVAQNAYQHGFCAADAVMPGEDDAAFARLLERKRAYWQPADDDEADLVDEIAVCTWRRWRLRRAESELWAARCGTGEDGERIANLGEAIAKDCDSNANAIEKVRRWWQGNERQLNRCEQKLQVRKRMQLYFTSSTRTAADRAEGRFHDALLNRPFPGETPATVDAQIRKYTEQTQLHHVELEQPVAEAFATVAEPVSPAPMTRAAPVMPAAPGAPLNRKERRRLERAQRKAERKAAKPGVAGTVAAD